MVRLFLAHQVNQTVPKPTSQYAKMLNCVRKKTKRIFTPSSLVEIRWAITCAIRAPKQYSASLSVTAVWLVAMANNSNAQNGCVHRINSLGFGGD